MTIDHPKPPRYRSQGAGAYCTIPQDLLFALAKAHLSARALVVALVIATAIYQFKKEHGSPKLMAYYDLEKITGLGAQEVRDALRELTERNIIYIVQPGAGTRPPAFHFHPDSDWKPAVKGTQRGGLLRQQLSDDRSTSTPMDRSAYHSDGSESTSPVDRSANDLPQASLQALRKQQTLLDPSDEEVQARGVTARTGTEAAPDNRDVNEPDGAVTDAEIARIVEATVTLDSEAIHEAELAAAEAQLEDGDIVLPEPLLVPAPAATPRNLVELRASLANKFAIGQRVGTPRGEGTVISIQGGRVIVKLDIDGDQVPYLPSELAVLVPAGIA